jgi:hypothetical protein
VSLKVQGGGLLAEGGLEHDGDSATAGAVG